MIYFTADTHFGHYNIIRYCNRPFQDLHEMDSFMTSMWNTMVKDTDTIYHLGDFARRDSAKYLENLSGKKILIVGSHDKGTDKLHQYFEKITPMLTIESTDGHLITLCHYCMRVWPHSHYNSWHLYGHSHGRLEPIGKSWDVGVDNNNFMPVSMLDIERFMDLREDNPNIVGKGRHRD